MIADQLTATNKRFYDALWTDARLIGPERFNTWTLAKDLSAGDRPRLEIGPGLRPRLPVPGTVFADISLLALHPLYAAGGRSAAALVTALPFADSAFGLVCAMDIIEHVADDRAAFAELARVSAPDAVLLLSVPLHPALWTVFDEAVGHYRRYDPAGLRDQLAAVGFTVERSAPSGMLPRASWLKNLGMWCLQHQRKTAMWWYNHIFLPIGLRRAPALALREGMIDLDNAAGVLLICRKQT